MKTRIFTYLSILLIASFFDIKHLTAQCNRSTDSLALVAFYHSTNGANWTTTWDLTQPINTWSGVTLNGNGCVQRIWLNNNNLNGPLPEEFGNLTNLREFRASNNNLTGQLPMSFYTMSNLETFWVSFNNLSGVLLPEVGQLTAMRVFNLGENDFSGELPPEIGNLNLITHFYFSNNNFEGVIPTEIANLQQMFVFHLENNQLTGEIPPTLATINSLASINLSNNQLTGNIPFEFSSMQDLEGLNLENNQLSGFVPDFSNNNLPLRNLRLLNNQFTFEDLVSSHPFNQNLINQNKEYSYDGYFFASQLPISKDTNIYGVQGATIIIDLEVDENIVTNEYRWFKEGVFLQSITGNNKLTITNLNPSDYGIYRCEITNPNIPELTLASGSFTLTEINCRQRDSMALVDLYTATNGANWINSWDLNTPIDTWYGVTLDGNGCVQNLDLDGELSCVECTGSGNNLIGELPISIWQMSNLVHLSLGNNAQLTGTLSTDISQLSQLVTLQLNANLSGIIPPELANLSHLTHLDLSGNQLSGLIPDFSIHNSILAFLSVANNQFIFEDIIPHINANEGLTNNNFLYAPQAKISEDESITEDVGYEVKLSLPGDYNGNSTYKWYKNAIFLTNAINELTLEHLILSDAGAYHCEITNSHAPNLTLLSGTFTVTVEQPNCHTRDSLALVAFYKATGGPSWTNTWDTLQPIATWYGVTLDDNGCVAVLDLDGNLDSNCPSCSGNGNNLLGSLPETFYELDRLRGIYFSNNAQFGGLLSPSLNKLNKLETIYSWRSNFSGELPQEIGALTRLVRLDFNYNHFSGALPTSLNQLTKLKFLNFWNSNFTGGIPDLNNLIQLEELGLSYNNFTGHIPSSLAKLANLKTLALIGNELSGNIPSFLSQLTNLQFLHLSENQFYGSIPNTLGNLPNLEVVNLGSNNLTGPIPPELSNGNNYTDVDLSGNKLQGSIPEGFETINVSRLFLQGNLFTGDISTQLASFSSLSNFRLERNQFLGVIPDLSIKNPTLDHFIFSDNNFTFEHILPNLTTNTNLITLNGGNANDYRYYPQNKVYKDTSITKNIGENLIIDLGIDEGLASNVYNWFKNGSYLTTINGNNKLTLTNLQYLDGGVYHCQVTNTIAPNLLLESHPIQLTIINPNCRTQDSLSLVTLYNATNGPNWTNTWDLNQAMDTWYGVILDGNGCVQTLDLDGFISTFCRSCAGNGNNLVGNLPSEIGDLTALEELSISGNNLGGTLPNQIGNLLNLKGLYFTNCNLTGAIPATLNSLFNLDNLYLNDNQFSGSIPNLGNLSKLKRIFCQDNILEGFIPFWLTNLVNLESIRFYNNRLTGSIPNGFENLIKLEDLDFRWNQLTGNLPSNLDKFRQLHFLNLDGNNIGGAIPKELASQSGNISLSRNNLEGELPSEFVDHQGSALHIDNNELKGDLFTILTGMENMFRLKLEENNFTGVIPDLSIKNPGLVGFYAQGNRFTFEHILPYHLINKTFTVNNARYETGYRIAPQQNFFKDTTITKAPNENLIIDLLIDDTVTTNVYKWYKDGHLHSTINGNNKLVINNVQIEDAGSYYCEVTNPNIPELTLQSYSIVVRIFDAICHQNDSLALVDLYNATNGANWTSTWDLNQPMDTWYGVTLNGSGCVQRVSLNNNNLNGHLPEEIGNLTSLQIFWVNDNNLTGPIPSEINNLTKLVQLEISKNPNLNSIPNLSGLTNLEQLNISWIPFGGSMPSWIGDLTSLKIFAAMYNNWEDLPASLANLTNLEILSIDGNKLSGSLPNWISSLNNLNLLTASENSLDSLTANFSTSNPNIFWFQIEENQFTFNDILPNISIPLFIYAPQQKIYKDTTILKGIGKNLTINLLIDDTVTTNIYKWYKDGQLITTINGNNEFTISNLQESDEGIYHVEITNPNAPLLTLMSHNISVEVLTDCYFHYEDLYDPVIPHTYNVQTTVESSGTIEQNTNVTFLAGSSITLKDGFHAEAGSNFTAEISEGSPCNGFVEPNNPSVERRSTINSSSKVDLLVSPNPSLGQTVITYALPEKQQVHLGLYNLSGQQIKEITPLGFRDAGIYQEELFTSNIEAGFYVVLLKTAAGTFSKKIVVAK